MRSTIPILSKHAHVILSYVGICIWPAPLPSALPFTRFRHKGAEHTSAAFLPAGSLYQAFRMRLQRATTKLQN